ncbi:MAG: hypothetical protein WAL77_00985 [Candidatus Dormiibacterota bacterium]
MTIRLPADDPPKIVHLVEKAIAPTARSTLDLLTLPFPFSQVDLLQPSDFTQAARQRRMKMWGGRDLDESGLQELHKQRVVVPFYCVSIAGAPKGQPVTVSQSLTAEHVRGTLVSELYRAAAEGRVTDPAAEPFTPWPTERVRTLWPTVEHGYLYSYHQLLGLEQSRGFVGSLRPKQRHRTHALDWLLPESDLPDKLALEGLASWRAVAITLSALDTRAWPDITRRMRHSLEVWRAATLAQPAAELAAWLRITPEQLRRQSERLRFVASLRDVIGDFYDLVRRADSAAWESLQGDARCAMDQRMGAEVLDRFADEIEGVRSADTSTPGVPVSYQGLNQSERSLDGVLTDLHLSPHPPLVVALEGKTEMSLFPMVMETLGVRLDPNWMRLVDFEGTLNLSLLARYAAEPVLGPDRGDHVVLDRPVTRFLVLTDAENKFATRADRAKQRRLLLDSMTKNIPRDLKRDLYGRQARVVEIATWGKHPFEFAHFTDRQIADGLLALAGKPYLGGRAALVGRVARERASRRPDADRVWPTSGIANLKVSLAGQLWPLLEKRIEAAIGRKTKGPPIMKAALRAYELATLSYRQRMSIRRHPDRRA